MKTLKIMIGLTLIAGLCAPLNADVFTAEADTVVISDSLADSNYGTRTYLYLGNNGANNKNKNALGFIRFDVSAFSGSVTNSYLTLELLDDFAADFDVYGIPDGVGDENFIETSLTFNNSSHTTTDTGIGTTGSLDPTGLSFLGSFSTSVSGPVEFNPGTSALNDYLNADSNGLATFLIHRTTVDGNPRQYFASRDATTGQPQLTVIPEPSSLALMAGAMVLAVGLLRRRK